jgi:hypothetical protein
MKTLVRWVVLASLLVLGVSSAQAEECEGVFFPNEITVSGQTLVLNGLGLREATAFNVNVYVAALYLPARTSNADDVINVDQARRLSLRFVRNVDRDDIVSAWRTGFRNNVSDVTPLQERLDRLNGWMENMRNGDRLSFTYVPGTGLTVRVGSTEKGTIEGEDFARAFFSIWFGSSPPNRGLKTGLLGGECG